jgi:CRISPR/Cas system-associated endoribonuclease Cas2
MTWPNLDGNPNAASCKASWAGNACLLDEGARSGSRQRFDRILLSVNTFGWLAEPKILRSATRLGRSSTAAANSRRSFTMAAFIITYDLLKSGQNYQALIKQLESWKAVRIQLSTWILQHSNTTCSQIRDGLSPHLDANDKLFVGKLTAAAWKPISTQMDAWLKQAIESA